MTVEGDDHTGKLVLSRESNGATDHRLVAQVDAIERAYARDRTGPLGSKQLQAEVDLHAGEFYRWTSAAGSRGPVTFFTATMPLNRIT
ncbi:MAG: hypothetical protein QOJ65_1549 [Fimbriimonadaceae bacterium]|nr:hypothetical protein [Fimbriimonadaceae bacterium]